MTFKEVHKKIPVVLYASFDPKAHTTIGGLRALARHELDLFEEGEETDIRTTRQLNAVRKFLHLCDRVSRQD